MTVFEHIFIFLLLVNPFVGFWVYLDATGNKIGKVKGWNSQRNMSAGAWGSLSLLQAGLWVVYVFSRRKLINLAKDNPADAGRRTVVTALLAVGYAMQLMLFGFFAYHAYFS